MTDTSYEGLKNLLRNMLPVLDHASNELKSNALAALAQDVRLVLEVERAQREDADFQAWQRSDVVKYCGFTIQKGHEHVGSVPRHTHSWVVVRNHCNALPGAGWCGSIAEAKLAIDCLVAAGYCDDVHMPGSTRTGERPKPQLRGETHDVVQRYHALWSALRAVRNGEV